jgi:hypothetical protein
MSPSSDDWNGSRLTLAPNDVARMRQTTNGSMIFAWKNLSERDNGGLSLSSGSRKPQSLDAPRGSPPSILVHNWRANNLTVVNVSVVKDTSIAIQAFGPGIAGQDPPTLQPRTPTPMQIGDALMAWPKALSNVIFRCDLGLALFGVIGGPYVSGNNAYVFAVNFPDDSTPPGYTATTQDNRYDFRLTWSGRIYIAYFGDGNVVVPGARAATSPATVEWVPLSLQRRRRAAPR